LLTTVGFSLLQRRNTVRMKRNASRLFGCEKCRAYLEYKEFELHCDNLALCWLLKRDKDIDRLGRWIQRLAPFKFRVTHTREFDDVIADALSSMFDGHYPENPDTVATMVGSLPLIYSSLHEHQRDDVFCEVLRKRCKTRKRRGINHNGLLCYFPKKAGRRRWVVSCPLRHMLLRYFHDGVFAGHLEARKTFVISLLTFGGQACVKNCSITYVNANFANAPNRFKTRKWGCI
jgi:hypothetical protein